jgi:hypothetical protein
MYRLVALAILLLPVTALAQQPSSHPHAMAQGGMPMDHTHMGGAPANGMPMDHTQMMDHARMMHDGMMQGGMMQGGMGGAQAPRAAAAPTEPGQGAFAAIQEIVQILEADPRTDWSKVDIEALRQHLVDMNNVTLRARVASQPIDGGMRFTVTGDGAVRDSIRRMTSAHAATMDGVGGWHFSAQDTDGGSIFEVRVPPQDMAKLKGLGFIGVLTVGMHHQGHHLMIARGEHPHQ